MTQRNKKGQFVKGIIPWNVGKRFPEEIKEKMRQAKLRNPTNYWLGRKRPEIKEWLTTYTKGHKPWNKGLKAKDNIKIRKSVEAANKAARGRPAWNKGKPWTPEMRKKLSGKNASNWKGGITPKSHKIRASIEARLWKESVFARDNYTCQKCQERGGKLRAHHIKNFAKYPELRFAIDNGITFCEECHRAFHKKYGIKNNDEQQLGEYLNG